MIPFQPRPLMFINMVAPEGFLDNYMETHALWYYYLCARQAWEQVTKDPMAYEGQLDSGVNYKQLFNSVARLYQVSPEHMVNCWQQIDKQCDLLRLPRLPDEERYRFCVPQSIILLS